MNKKIILPISLILLVGLAGVVYSYEIEYGTSIYKGWNLVYGFVEPDQIQGLEISNIKAIYAFFPKSQEYVRLYPNPQDKVNTINNPDDSEELRNTAFWVYSDSETGEDFNGLYNGVEYWLTSDPIPFNERQLYKGWNFVGITSDMLGKSLNELKGNCNIEKSYAWWAKRQTWDLIDMNDAPFSQNIIGQGIVLKLTENCKLGASPGAIPTVPNLP